MSTADTKFFALEEKDRECSECGAAFRGFKVFCEGTGCRESFQYRTKIREALNPPPSMPSGHLFFMDYLSTEEVEEDP
jgi:hypothetical protein